MFCQAFRFVTWIVTTLMFCHMNSYYTNAELTSSCMCPFIKFLQQQQKIYIKTTVIPVMKNLTVPTSAL
jgi:hypothetical protein